MIRLLLFILLLYVLYKVITWRSIASGNKRIRHPEAEEMVACASCGTFVSRREAEEKEGKFYCRPSCQK